MKNSGFATGAKDPWCMGCGHTLVVRSLQKSLEGRYDPKDVVLVTDIGCIGMADGMFTCHTVHGLHGRAPALAAGISITASRPETKVVVLMGDGGAAIGLQHIMESARLNTDMTLIVCNNQNYGMTGGQHSAYTLEGVKTTTTLKGVSESPFALCEMLAPLGVKRDRVMATDRALTDLLTDALAHHGFSLVETMNYCPSYTGKLNPEDLTPRAMKAFCEARGLAFGRWEAKTKAPPYRFSPDPRPIEPAPLPRHFDPGLAGQVRILLAGSAGEGVQSAATVFAQAAIRSGLEVVVRGEYPITVGKGFSAAFILLSPDPILSPSAERWDVGMAISEDGLRYAGDRLGSIDRLVMDASLDSLPASEAGGAEHVDFRAAGARQAAFAALCWLMIREGYFPVEALREAVESVRSAAVRKSLFKVLDAGL